MGNIPRVAGSIPIAVQQFLCLPGTDTFRVTSARKVLVIYIISVYLTIRLRARDFYLTISRRRRGDYKLITSSVISAIQ